MSEGIDYVQRARDLAPMLREAETDIETRRELPHHVVSTLIDGGFFRMLQPRFLGGTELRPVLFTQVTEALARTNASVAWCIGQNNGCSMSAAYLDREVAEEIFGPPTGILAWGPPGAPYEAQPVEGATASVGDGGLPAAATTRAGLAPICRWPGRGRCGRCCSESRACR